VRAGKVIAIAPDEAAAPTRRITGKQKTQLGMGGIQCFAQRKKKLKRRQGLGGSEIGEDLDLAHADLEGNTESTKKGACHHERKDALGSVWFATKRLRNSAVRGRLSRLFAPVTFG